MLLPPVLFLVGPTAVGKSALAAEVAARCGGEIVNADAFQVYDGLDLLSAKPSPAVRRTVPHHLFGIVTLGEEFNVARYLSLARSCLEGIAKRGRPAIVVGGTGLYVKALTHGLAPLPPADPGLRVELEALALWELGNRLRELDPTASASLDLKNKRRVVRAVEICMLTGGRFSDLRTGWDAQPAEQGVYLTRPPGDLHQRIRRRLDEMFRAGVVEEVRRLPTQAIGPTAARMIGLADIRAFIRGEISEEVCRERLELATRHYAKRQRTWFQRETIFLRRELPDITAAGEWEAEVMFATNWILARSHVVLAGAH